MGCCSLDLDRDADISRVSPSLPSCPRSIPGSLLHQMSAAGGNYNYNYIFKYIIIGQLICAIPSMLTTLPYTLPSAHLHVYRPVRPGDSCVHRHDTHDLSARCWCLQNRLRVGPADIARCAALHGLSERAPVGVYYVTCRSRSPQRGYPGHDWRIPRACILSPSLDAKLTPPPLGVARSVMVSSMMSYSVSPT